MTSLAGASARPVFHVMLFGNVTGRPYGWASPGEIELMLAAGSPGPDNCPPAAGGHRRRLRPRPAQPGAALVRLKLTGIARPEVHRDITSPFAYAGTQSLDSASWSRSARYD